MALGAAAAAAAAAAQDGLGSAGADDLAETPLGAVLLGEEDGPAAWEQLRPALVRQEAEGGCLYIAALQRCVRGAATSNSTGPAVAAECEARLADFCLWVVHGAAQRVGPAGAEGAGSAAEEAAAAVAAALAAAAAASPGSAGGMMGTPPGGGAPNPADQSWDDAVRCSKPGAWFSCGWCGAGEGRCRISGMQ